MPQYGWYSWQPMRAEKKSRLAGVEAHANPNRSTVGPGLGGKRALRRNRRGDCVTRAWEGDEECVALRVDLVALELGERLAQQTCVRREGVVVTLAEALEQPRRPLDVGEEERHRSGRAVHHALPNPIPLESKSPARLGFGGMAEPTREDIDTLVGPATPHFAYQLRARVEERILDLPDGHPVKQYGLEQMELLDRLGHASSKAAEGGREPRSRLGWDEIPSSAPADDPLPPRQ